MKSIVLMPTYNEKLAIKSILDELKAIDILIIDDNSPDGTADYVNSLNYENVEILRRKAKDGLGNAYKAAIEKVLSEKKYTHLISMDADGSHRPEDLAALLEISKENPDAVILGSRWVPGGSIINWPRYRKWISKAGTWYAKFALKMDLKDLTGGFRIYPSSVLEKLDLSQITSNGYCYQIEMAFALKHLNNSQIIEVPITFIEREQGVSKMSQRIVLEAMVKVTRLGIGLRLNPTADKLHYVK
jgi:dolichol-phosphate mannosyltransferase